MSEIYEPAGIRFYDVVSGREMLYVQEGWAKDMICYRHPDGQWVTLREATENDKKILGLSSKEKNAIKDNEHKTG